MIIWELVVQKKDLLPLSFSLSFAMVLQVYIVYYFSPALEGSMPLRNSSSIYKEMALDTKTAPGMLTAISVPLRLVFLWWLFEHGFLSLTTCPHLIDAM